MKRSARGAKATGYFFTQIHRKQETNSTGAESAEKRIK